MHGFFSWLDMGRYAAYVWPAYGFAGGVLLFNILAMKIQKKQTRRMLKQWVQQSQ